MHLRKTACILHAALRVDRHRPPLRRGPFTGSASMRSRAELSLRSAGDGAGDVAVDLAVDLAGAVAVVLARRSARSSRGPCEAALGGGSARRVADRMSDIVSSAHGCAVETTRHPARTPGTGMCRGRFAGVSFLLVTFLDSGHPALRPSGRLRRSRRSCGAVDKQRKVTRPLQRAEALDLASSNYPPTTTQVVVRASLNLIAQGQLHLMRRTALPDRQRDNCPSLPVAQVLAQD
jgi:hypothetical protein